MSQWVQSPSPDLIPVPIDPKHFEQLLAELAELLYNNLSERQLAPVYNGGPIPLGYELDPDQRGKLRVEPSQAKPGLFKPLSKLSLNKGVLRPQPGG
jgi:hypothetical protein